jgi:hypothetical protein
MHREVLRLSTYSRLVYDDVNNAYKVKDLEWESGKRYYTVTADITFYPHRFPYNYRANPHRMADWGQTGCISSTTLLPGLCSSRDHGGLGATLHVDQNESPPRREPSLLPDSVNISTKLKPYVYIKSPGSNP